MQINELIKSRRSIAPSLYNGQAIAKETIEQLLENANFAPTHKLSQPWRFKIFHSEAAREKLSNYMMDFFEKNTTAENFSDIKMKKAGENPLKAACVIALCIKPDPTLPEWEEVAALACSVENIWLTCAATGIGCYWGTPKSAIEARAFLGLEEDEKCFGFLYLGYSDLPTPAEKNRKPVAEKITWM
jgi:nitroreductase